MKNFSTNVTQFSFCEILAEFFLPNFYSNKQVHGFSDFYEFLFNLNQTLPDLNEKILSKYSDFTKLNSYLINNLIQDIQSSYNFCLKLESNLVYFEWILTLYLPLLYASLIFLISPIMIVFSLYGCSFFLFFSKHWSKLRIAYETQDLWQASIKCVMIFTESLGALLHGHELIGLENIPDQGPGLLIYYHALLPVDYYYVHAKVHLYKNRRMKIVADRFLFKMPGFGTLLEALEVTPGSVDSCTNILKEGHLMSISPGGLKEAIYSDSNYQLIWGSRCGFAKVAQGAKAFISSLSFQCSPRTHERHSKFFPILRVNFNNSKLEKYLKENLEEISHKIYDLLRLPVLPIYGIFPVKLRTYIGEPIPYDESRTPEELKQLTKERIEELINKHQRLPGSWLHAVLDRFRRKRLKKD